MKVILVRHAETEWNMRGIIQGHSDSPLTHKGLRETSALLAALAASDHQVECGEFEGVSTDLFGQNHQNEAHALFERDADYCPPGGESLAHASQRVMDFLYRLEATSRHQSVCIVSHGHVSQGVLARLNEGAIVNFPRYAQPNASYSVFDLINGQCSAVSWGIATHLLKLA